MSDERARRKQRLAAAFRLFALYGFDEGVADSTAEGARIAATLGAHKAIILQNHGLLTVGGSVDEAAWWFITMDRSCDTQLRAEAAGEPIAIAEAMARHTREQIGIPQVG